MRRSLWGAVSALRTVGARKAFALFRARRWGWERVIHQYFLTRAVQTLLRLGLLDELRRGDLDVDVVARERGLDRRLLLSLCEYLYARRILRRHAQNRFGLDTDGRFIASSDLLQGWFLLADGYEPVMHELEGLVRGTRTYGEDVTRDGKSVAIGSGLASAAMYFPMACAIVGASPGPHRIADLGCGDGTFLRYAVRTLKGATAVGIDLSPEAVAEGRARLADERLDDRVSLYQGDALQLAGLRAALEGVTALTSFFVMHELLAAAGREGVVTFLREMSGVPRGAKFVIFEVERPSADDLRRRPGPAVEYFFFHDLSNQRPITRTEWLSIFRDAGRELAEEYHLGFARTAVYVIR